MVKHRMFHLFQKKDSHTHVSITWYFIQLNLLMGMYGLLNSGTKRAPGTSTTTLAMLSSLYFFCLAAILSLSCLIFLLQKKPLINMLILLSTSMRNSDHDIQEDFKARGNMAEIEAKRSQKAYMYKYTCTLKQSSAIPRTHMVHGAHNGWWRMSLIFFFSPQSINI